MEDVANDCASRGGHDTDRPWQEGEGTFPCRIEQPVCLESCLELFEKRQERTFARHFHRVDHDLVVGAPGVCGEFASGDHFDPVLRDKGETPGIAFPHDAVDPRVFILQREIEVPRRCPLETRNLSANADMAEALLHMAFEGCRNFADRKHARIVALPLLG